MEFTKPRVFHLAQTQIDQEGLAGYLEEIGAPNWDTNAPTDAEKFIEVCGKQCYRAFHADLNANLTRVRDQDNEGYLKNILTSRHGSVIEHVYDSFALVGVSRV